MKGTCLPIRKDKTMILIQCLDSKGNDSIVMRGLICIALLLYCASVANSTTNLPTVTTPVGDVIKKMKHMPDDERALYEMYLNKAVQNESAIMQDTCLARDKDNAVVVLETDGTYIIGFESHTVVCFVHFKVVYTQSAKAAKRSVGEPTIKVLEGIENKTACLPKIMKILRSLFSTLNYDLKIFVAWIINSIHDPGPVWPLSVVKPTAKSR